MEGIRFILRRGRMLFGVVVLVCLMLSALPLAWTAGRSWPSFFYSPFYTNNIFSDATTPAYQAGLRPEDRVVQAGARPGQWPRINALAEQTALAAELNGPLTLLYELGREATTIPVTVEKLSWWRLLEKSGPFFLAALLLAFRALAGKAVPLEKRLFAGGAALALLAAPDYFLNPGNGLNSGFVLFGPFAPDDWLLKSAKWSSYLYAPLWKCMLAAGTIYYLRFTIKGVQSPESRVQSPESRVGNSSSSFIRSIVNRQSEIVNGLVLALLVFDLISYFYEAIRTAIYNNPDYVVWHERSAFWPEWIGFGLVVGVAQFKKGRASLKGWLGIVGLLFFLAGFMIPTTFEIGLPGPGAQWYVFGLVAFINFEF